MQKVCINYVILSAIAFPVILPGSCNKITANGTEIIKGEEEVKINTDLNFQNPPENFRFAVLGDRTGGQRPGVFSASVDLLNRVQPSMK